MLLASAGLLVLIVGFAVAYGRARRDLRGAWRRVDAAAQPTLHADPGARWRDLEGVTMASLAADPALLARVRVVVGEPPAPRFDGETGATEGDADPHATAPG